MDRRTLITPVLLFATVVVLPGAQPKDVRRIVAATIAAHGSVKLARSDVTFAFRDDRYRMRRIGGKFSYERWTTQGGRKIHDILTNDGLVRRVDGQAVSLPEVRRRSVARNINSVVYFASLPLPLLDPAAKHRYAGSDEIRGIRYDRVEVAFTEEGGGDDHEDVFMYWIRQEDHRIDYLAYRFRTGDGGVRFRAAYNRTVVNNVTFQQYLNYRPPHPKTDLEMLGALFEQGRLELVSRIETHVASVDDA